MMVMLVLAGGFGTRLQSVVSDVPKALAPIGAVPFLRLQLESWRSQGVRNFVFLLHHQAELIIQFLQAERDLLRDCEVRWLVEPRPMDTGGAVAYAVSHFAISGEFLLTNADTWLGGGIQEMRVAMGPAMAVVSVGDAARYGQVKFDASRTVLAFSEKGAQREPGWINAGLCKLPANIFASWDGEPFSMERVLFPRLLSEGRLNAVPLQTSFIDIGIPNDYHRFRDWIESGREGSLCS